MCNALVLRLPGVDILQTEASDNGIGAVLLQIHDGQSFPVMFASKKLTGAQKSYATVEKECLAIVWAIDKCNAYQYERKLYLQTDHQPLAFLSDAKMTNPEINEIGFEASALSVSG